jgi:PAS domain S-box-containing protein
MLVLNRNSKTEIPVRIVARGTQMKAPALDANESAAYLSLRPLRLTHLQRYGLAVLSVGIALGVGLLLDRFHFRVPSALLLLFAVALSSWRGGRGPAVLAAILSVIAFYWYFVEPVRTIRIYPSEIPYFITFVSFAALLSWFGTIRRRVEADLREQAALLNLTHDTVFVMDLEGVIKYWNRGAEEQYGWTAEQALGRGVHDLLKTVLPAPLEEIKAKLTRTGRWEGELRHTKKDGTQLVVASRWALQRGGQGAPAAILETSNDITERKRAEEELRRTAAYLADAQRLTHTGAWAGDRTTAPLYWSEEVFRIFGFDPQQGLPARDQPLERIHPEDLDKFLQGFHRTIDEKVDSEVEYRVVLPDGTLKHVHAAAHPVVDLNGELVEVVGTVVDITERKRAEETLRESEARFRTFVDHATDAFFLIDDEAKVLDVNRQACESLGYTREELIGMRPYDFDPNVDSASLRSLGERLDTGVVCSFETCHRRKDGTLLPVEVRLRRFWQGGHSLSLALTRDITDRKRAEAERDRLRQLEADLAHINRVSMMGELAASVAHEVNQPLSGVVSNASAGLRWLAADVPNLEEAREGLRRIVRDGKRAGEVIARIRALTRKAATPAGKLDLNETIREVLALIGDEAKRKSVIVRTQFAGDLSPVSGDRVQLQQVVLNLVMNAIEAMSVIDVRARELAIGTRNIDPDQVQVTVQDSGIGIAPQTLDKIFESFYTTKPGGMGMGLSISRSILQAHGGRIWATANDGRGTIFHFTLPKYHEEGSNAEVAGI